MVGMMFGLGERTGSARPPQMTLGAQGQDLPPEDIAGDRKDGACPAPARNLRYSSDAGGAT